MGACSRCSRSTSRRSCRRETARDTETAARFYAKASDTRPDSWIPPYNLASLRAISGDPEQAMRLLDRVIHLGFTAPQLLDQNDDFASVRARPGWRSWSRARAAAAAAPRRSALTDRIGPPARWPPGTGRRARRTTHADNRA